eukprot:m.125283 g.125283  ORF g.125283 m.125283 type:complete len:550 (-) comp9372_c0_seq5:174-1823(-)
MAGEDSAPPEGPSTASPPLASPARSLSQPTVAAVEKASGSPAEPTAGGAQDRPLAAELIMYGPAPQFSTSGQERGRGGRKAGALNYTRDEVSLLLDVIGSAAPVRNEEWQRIAARFNERARLAGMPERDFESLRSKYKKVHMPPRRSFGSGDQSQGADPRPRDALSGEAGSRDTNDNGVPIAMPDEDADVEMPCGSSNNGADELSYPAARASTQSSQTHADLKSAEKPSTHPQPDTKYSPPSGPDSRPSGRHERDSPLRHVSRQVGQAHAAHPAYHGGSPSPQLNSGAHPQHGPAPHSSHQPAPAQHLAAGAHHYPSAPARIIETAPTRPTAAGVVESPLLHIAQSRHGQHGDAQHSAYSQVSAREAAAGERHTYSDTVLMLNFLKVQWEREREFRREERERELAEREREREHEREQREKERQHERDLREKDRLREQELRERERELERVEREKERERERAEREKDREERQRERDRERDERERERKDREREREDRRREQDREEDERRRKRLREEEDSELRAQERRAQARREETLFEERLRVLRGHPSVPL